MNKIRYLILVFFLIQFGYAQDNFAVNNDIRFSVNSDTITFGKFENTVGVNVLNNSGKNLDQLSVQLGNIECDFALVSAVKDGQNLWLKNATGKSMEENVLCWSEENGVLVLYPPDWIDFKQLELQVRIDLTKKEETTQANIQLLTRFENETRRANSNQSETVINLK